MLNSGQIPKRTRIKVMDPFATVRVSPVRVNGCSVANKGIEILTDRGNWEAINIHSSAYNLVSNADAHDAVQRILADTHLTWENTGEVWTGRYWSRFYRSDSMVDVPSVGDTVSLGLRVENSYDGSCQFRLVLMAYVLSCSNGLVSPRHFKSYTMKHLASNGFSTAEAVAEIGEGLSQVKDLLPLIDSLAGIPLSIGLLAQVARETPVANRDWGHITKGLKEASSAWDLMQAITGRLTHHGRGRTSVLNSERVGDYFLFHIAAGHGAV